MPVSVVTMLVGKRTEYLDKVVLWKIDVRRELRLVGSKEKRCECLRREIKV